VCTLYIQKERESIQKTRKQTESCSDTKLQSKVESVMLSGVRSEAEERNEASVQILRFAQNDMIERNLV
jgi:hypothetical protein